jgi:hypothetical protein
MKQMTRGGLLIGGGGIRGGKGEQSKSQQLQCPVRWCKDRHRNEPAPEGVV